MTKRILLMTLLSVGPAMAYGQAPTAEPGRLPPLGNSPGVTVGQQPQELKTDNLPAPKPTVALARAEKPLALGPVDLTRHGENWHVMAGKTLFCNTGSDWKSAEKISNVLRSLQFSTTNSQSVSAKELSQTSWHTIGESRPVVGYVTTADGQAARLSRGVTHQAINIQLATLRAENVRGVFVVRDDHNILLNFGPDKTEAEQAVAVALRYGMNRLGYVGTPENATFRYFFAQEDDPRLQVTGPESPLKAVAQEMALDRIGVEIPGVGTVGQKTNIDASKLAIRKDGSEFSLVSGTNVIAKFGRDEWSARDAERILKQMKPTTMVTIGSPGITFFMQGGDVAKRLPFGTVGAPFSNDRLTARAIHDGTHRLYDQLGREIARSKTAADIDAIKAAISHFNLNRTCQIGNQPQSSLSFLAKVE